MVYYIVSISLMLFGVCMFFSFLTLLVWDKVYILSESLLSLATGEIEMIFFVDWVSCLFSSFVFFISSSVVFYSIEYMSSYRLRLSFLGLVLVFVASMFLVIFSLNMASLILGWDGLGLSSYLLVIFYQNSKSLSAGMITALTNRIGDVAIMLTVALMVEAGGWEFMSLVWGEDKSLDTKLGLLIILACITKSAQLPFSAWLPAAMAAPTPVSSLVHSSTLVTAGVYLLLRFNPFLSECGLNTYMLVLGGGTMVMAGLSAMVEMDLKKVVALSTLSQLGLMVISLSAGLYLFTLFHLLTHACFKALLFLSSGKIMHDLGGTQDIRFMGGLSDSMPITSSCFLLANVSLCGFPFMAGFYSKDMILEGGIMEAWSGVYTGVVFTGVVLSAGYSIRLLYLGLLKSPSYLTANSVGEKFSPLNLAGLFLVLLSVSSGCFLSWLMFPAPCLSYMSFEDKSLALMGVMSGGMLALLNLSEETEPESAKAEPGLDFIWSLWYLGSISGRLSSEAGEAWSSFCLEVEEMWYDYGLSYKSTGKLLEISKNWGQVQNNLYSSFIGVTFIGGVVLIFMWIT